MEELEELLRNMARNAIRLEPGEGEGAEVGRFGGLPDVPEDFAWPTFKTATYNDEMVKDRPLSFLAQFDCAALAALDPEGLLPHDGVLSFFYELDSQRWGYSPEDAGCARVYWFKDKAALAPAAGFPGNLEECFLLPSMPFRAGRKTEYPCYGDFSLTLPDSLAYSEEGMKLWDMFERACGVLQGSELPEPCHKLLGWPDLIQDNMTMECELVSRGHYLGSMWETVTEEEKRQARETSLDGWRLLFQLDTISVGDFELMFGDCGSIYFYIRKEDLAAGCFSRVWLIQQCC